MSLIVGRCCTRKRDSASGQIVAADGQAYLCRFPDEPVTRYANTTDLFDHVVTGDYEPRLASEGEVVEYVDTIARSLRPHERYTVNAVRRTDNGPAYVLEGVSDDVSYRWDRFRPVTATGSVATPKPVTAEVESGPRNLASATQKHPSARPETGPAVGPETGLPLGPEAGPDADLATVGEWVECVNTDSCELVVGHKYQVDDVDVIGCYRLRGLPVSRWHYRRFRRVARPLAGSEAEPAKVGDWVECVDPDFVARCATFQLGGRYEVVGSAFEGVHFAYGLRDKHGWWPATCFKRVATPSDPSAKVGDWVELIDPNMFSTGRGPYQVTGWCMDHTGTHLVYELRDKCGWFPAEWFKRVPMSLMPLPPPPPPTPPPPTPDTDGVIEKYSMPWPDGAPVEPGDMVLYQGGLPSGVLVKGEVYEVACVSFDTTLYNFVGHLGGWYVATHFRPVSKLTGGGKLAALRAQRTTEPAAGSVKSCDTCRHVRNGRCGVAGPVTTALPATHGNACLYFQPAIKEPVAVKELVPGSLEFQRGPAWVTGAALYEAKPCPQCGESSCMHARPDAPKKGVVAVEGHQPLEWWDPE